MNRFLLSLLTALLPLSLFAEDAKPKQGAYVVMVGAGSFGDASISARPTAESDAKAMYDLFTDKNNFDIAKDRAVLLSGPQATREAVIKAVHEAVAKTGKDDLIVLGLFGRGASSGDGTAFFTADSTVKDRAKNAFLGSDLAAELKAAKDRKILFLADVSYNVKELKAEKETLIEPSLRDVINAVFGTGDDHDEEPAVNDKLLALASIPSSEPLVKDGRGLFSLALAEALKGKADNDGYGADGLVNAQELVKYLEDEAAAMIRETGKTTKEKETVPFLIGGTSSKFPITMNPAESGKRTARLAAIAKLQADGKLDKETAEEGAALIGRMPKLKNLQDLRKAFIALADGGDLAAFTEARKATKAAMVLSPADAAAFARKTFNGLDLLQARYIKKLTKGEYAAHAVRGLYKNLESPIPSEIDEQLKTAKDADEKSIMMLLGTARMHLGKREDLEGDKGVDLALNMMCQALNDPYTVYLDAETRKKEESRMRSQFSGIGIHIRRDMARDGLLCVAPIKNSPAYKAGLQAGDLIVEVRRDVDAEGKKITDEKEKVISTKGMKMDDALKLILGRPGVPVTVVIERDGKILPPITIERGRVSLETVLGVSRKENNDWDFWLDKDNKIAYIYLTQFGPNTHRELRAALEECRKEGMKGLILDLRYNPGGLLSAAVWICDMFTESGPLVTIRPRVGTEEAIKDSGDRFGSFNKNPKIVVMINGNSASASEIVSACMKDNARAIIVGERSYGKGSVQTIEDFDETKGQFKFTTARYFPPSDKNIDKKNPDRGTDEWGVKPDKGYEWELTREEKSDLAENLLNKELLKKQEVKEGKAPFVDKQRQQALDLMLKELGAVAGAKK